MNHVEARAVAVGPVTVGVVCVALLRVPGAGSPGRRLEILKIKNVRRDSKAKGKERGEKGKGRGVAAYL